MGFFCIHLVWNETHTFPHPEDMSINREGISSHSEKKEAMDGFGADPFEPLKGLLDLFGTHLFQEEKAQLPSPILKPLQDLANAPCFLLGQSARPDGLHNGACPCLEEIFPLRESGFQRMIGSISISVVRVL